MEDLTFKIIFIVLMVIAAIGRAPYAIKSKKIKVMVSKRKGFEIFLLSLSSLIMITPLVYVFTDWIDSFNFNLPLFVRIIGVLGFAFAVFLHNWSHVALSVNWSPTLEIKKNQKLITTGPYKYVRHPMYAAFFIWAIFQGILLSNSLVLAVGIISIAIVYFSRVDAEEQMMIEQFGKQYREYMERTGRLWLKIV